MKTAVSGCLLGLSCRYDGKSKPAHKCTDSIKEIVVICPECMGGLEIPREPCEIVGGDGQDVLDGKARVMSRDGVDRTAEYIKGAYSALEIIKAEGIERAVLKANSPSCGTTHIYDGTFSKTKIEGCGVLSALLIRNGIRIYDEDEFMEVIEHGE